MQKIFVVIIVVIFCSNKAEAQALDLQFERTYLTQSMRHIPSNCSEAREALSTFLSEASRQRNLDSNADWADEFLNANKTIMEKRVEEKCHKVT